MRRRHRPEVRRDPDTGDPAHERGCFPLAENVMPLDVVFL